MQTMQATSQKALLGWGVFAVVAIAAIALFGFVAICVLAFVVGVTLIRAGWLMSSLGPRIACWVGALVVFAIPVLLYLDAALSYQVVKTF